jgi:prepilin signal peptidase PulO-like enzyme (type II secretory pathway)
MLILKIWIFFFGMLIGSFLNVVIHRVPKNESVVKPRSKCPNCGHMIKWYQNIPVISWLFLKGKCANCGFKIPIKYPLIELLVGFIAYNLFPEDLSPQTLFGFAYFFSVACILLSHFVIDIEHQILPDKINIYFLLITLPYVILTMPYMHWLLGGVFGFFGPLAVTWIFYKLRGQIGLGGGDIKLFGILGLLLGPVGIMHNIFMSCFLGAIIGIILIATKKLDKNTPLAFGPYIIFVASFQIFFPSYFEMVNPFVNL